MKGYGIDKITQAIDQMPSSNKRNNQSKVTIYGFIRFDF